MRGPVCNHGARVGSEGGARWSYAEVARCTLNRRAGERLIG